MRLSHLLSKPIGLICICSQLPVASAARLPANHEKGDKRTVVWAINDVVAGARITDSDLQEVAVRKGRIPGLLRCRNEAVGHKASRYIHSGQVLMQHDLVRSDALAPVKTTCHGTTVVILRHNIPMGVLLKDSDLAIKSLDPFSAGKDWISRTDFAVGFKTKCALLANSVLTPEMLTPTQNCLNDPRKMAAVYGATWDQRSAPSTEK